MKSSFLIVIQLFLVGALNAQFHYTISSSPDSAIVLMNGEVQGVTPCRVSYYWKDKVNGRITFEVKAPGYETWSDSITSKPRDFDKVSRITLEPVVGALTFDTLSPLIAFDKLLFSLENGDLLGNITGEDGVVRPIKWEGTTKLGSTVFDRTFYKRMTVYGYNTPYSVEYKLFSEDEKRKLLPRFLVGVKIIEYTLHSDYSDEKSYKSGQYVTKVGLKIEWQVMDKSTDKVVYVYTNEGAYRKREMRPGAGKDIALNAFEMALIDFAEKSEFHQLIDNYEPAEILHQASEDLDELKIESVKNPTFSKLSEMIQYSSQSCVTIVTDAGHGSGVIISEDGYVLTANHVIQGVNKLKIQLSSGIELNATLERFDFKSDVALLKMEGSGFHPLPMSKEIPGLGEEVVTIGTPADIELGQSVSKGMISGKRMVEGQMYFQVDMSVSPGNSGGPLLNGEGHVVGIVQKKLVGEGIEGIGFALPIDSALDILKIVIK